MAMIAADPAVIIAPVCGLIVGGTAGTKALVEPTAPLPMSSFLAHLKRLSWSWNTLASAMRREENHPDESLNESTETGCYPISQH